ncbi:molecular chaperone DnaJ ['Camptotheca acuminata' phytoplasma]|uniref:molecular chaperone DnaJ n=1 Tax='Camptotheca acuminata' phytoplasma TaxID=3239192 RepID=UPI003519FB36
MSVKRDYYDVLGVPKNADLNTIKKSYRMLVKKYHPDVSKETNAAEKFKEVQEAYQVLSNEEKRSNYDRFGHQDNYNNFGGGSGGGFQDFGQEFSFDDIFDGFFGNRKQSSQSRNNFETDDKHVEIQIDFLEACLGTEKEIQFKIEEDCGQCKGTGAQSLKDLQNCAYCNGTGYIKRTQSTFLGNISTKQVCSHCHGVGQKILKKCSFCKGSQRVSNLQKIKISIPAGIEDKMTIKMPNKGNGGHLGSYNSDLYILVKIRPHDTFTREKQDIISVFLINFYDAILGNTFSVPTIYGEINLKIPEGTQTHTKFKIKNKGVPYLNSSYRKGDHYVIVKVKIPTKLTSHQKKLIQQIKELDTFQENTKQNKSWFFNL